MWKIHYKSVIKWCPENFLFSKVRNGSGSSGLRTTKLIRITISVQHRLDIICINQDLIWPLCVQSKTPGSLTIRERVLLTAAASANALAALTKWQGMNGVLFLTNIKTLVCIAQLLKIFLITGWGKICLEKANVTFSYKENRSICITFNHPVRCQSSHSNVSSYGGMNLVSLAISQAYPILWIEWNPSN